MSGTARWSWTTLYLLFNEGYKSSSGGRLVREELCYEAIRLALQLARHPATREPRTHALLALMLFNAARLPARVSETGNLLRLHEQDRKCLESGDELSTSGIGPDGPIPEAASLPTKFLRS